MTIQVGYPHECPTLFLSTSPGGSQRVNKFVSDRSDKSDSSDATKSKSPLAPKFAPVVAYINHNFS